MRKVTLATGEIYHVFNRGVDKRDIFIDQADVQRFSKSMIEFNSVTPIGSLYEQSFKKDKTEHEPLVKFIALNILDNHFHFILEQMTENGISQFMKRLQGGYTWYFNNKYKRSGALLQGAFKASHVGSNEYLLHLSVYVNLNDKLPLGDRTAKLGVFSSWNEYLSGNTNDGLCLGKNIILDQFRSIEEYKKFALSSLEDIRNNKERYKKLEE